MIAGTKRFSRVDEAAGTVRGHIDGQGYSQPENRLTSAQYQLRIAATPSRRSPPIRVALGTPDSMGF